MSAPTYLISRALDPVFALGIGLAAAATRIHREEKEKGMQGGWKELGELGLRRLEFLKSGKLQTQKEDVVRVSGGEAKAPREGKLAGGK